MNIKLMRFVIVLVVSFVCFLFCGCEPSKKSLVAGYQLELFNENGKYYLTCPGDTSGGGIFDGTVEQIGWNKVFILARVTRLSGGDTNGWYALDLKTKQISGPIQESEIKTNSILSGIGCRDSATVFTNKN